MAGNDYKNMTVSELLKMAHQYIEKKEIGEAKSIADYFLKHDKLYSAGEIFNKIRLTK